MLLNDSDVNWDINMSTPDSYYSASATCRDARTNIHIIANAFGEPKWLIVKHKTTGAINLETDTHKTNHVNVPMVNGKYQQVHMNPWMIRITPKGFYVEFQITDERNKNNPIMFDLRRYLRGCDAGFQSTVLNKK